MRKDKLEKKVYQIFEQMKKQKLIETQGSQGLLNKVTEGKKSYFPAKIGMPSFANVMQAFEFAQKFPTDDERHYFANEMVESFYYPEIIRLSGKSKKWLKNKSLGKLILAKKDIKLSLIIFGIGFICPRLFSGMSIIITIRERRK